MKTVEFSFIGDESVRKSTQFFFAGFSLQLMRQLAKVTGINKLIVSPMPVTHTALVNLYILQQTMISRLVNLPMPMASNRWSRGGSFGGTESMPPRPGWSDAIINFLDTRVATDNIDNALIERTLEMVDEIDDNVRTSPLR